MKKHLIAGMLLFCSTIISSTSVYGNEVEVVDVKVTVAGGNQYRFEVTLEHEDENWEHFANRWEILDADGNILATRVLHHPHVYEQPFTRSLTTKIPDNLKKVTIRGHDSVHAYGGVETSVPLN